jgi:hypothetical protein
MRASNCCLRACGAAHLETNNGWFVNTQLDVCFRCFMGLFGVGDVKSRFTHSLSLSLCLSPNTYNQAAFIESSGTLIVLRWWLVNNLAESIHGQLQNKRHFGCATRLSSAFPGNRPLTVSHFTLSWQLWRWKQFIRAPLRLITLSLSLRLCDS